MLRLNLQKQVKYAKIDFSQDKITDDCVNHLKRALMSGFPFVFGFTVYESFESEEVAKTGMVPMPKEGEKNSRRSCCLWCWF